MNDIFDPKHATENKSDRSKERKEQGSPDNDAQSLQQSQAVRSNREDV
jgi:hypothetical protein